MSEKPTVINPSSGLFARNPTHIEEANEADDQDEIVKAIKGSNAKRMRVVYTYGDVDPKNPIPFMGITKIREMPEESAIQMCKNIMRNRPNIFKMNIKLGNYPSTRRIDNIKTRALNSDKQRYPTEVGEKFGELLSDPSLHVVEISYRVNTMSNGIFSTSAEVFVTNDEEYQDNKFFSPTIEFEYIKTT